MKTEQIEWWTPKERLPKEGSNELMVKTGSDILTNCAYFWNTWASEDGAQLVPDFWAYNPKGPR